MVLRLVPQVHAVNYDESSDVIYLSYSEAYHGVVFRTQFHWPDSAVWSFVCLRE
jgi:hypothetical protein